MTIFKLHGGPLTVKIYTQGERVLRTEAVVHDTAELRCGRSLDKFPQIVSEAKSILQRFIGALSWVDQCFVGDAMLEQLPKAIGQTKVGGIDLNKTTDALGSRGNPRPVTSPQRVYRFGVGPSMRSLSLQSESEYGPRHAAMI